MEYTFVLVVYDISHDRRRTKLHNLLLDYGTPVQYSVFECMVDKDKLEKMKKAIRKIIRPKKDNVRYYSLCSNCVAKIEASHGDTYPSPPDALVV